MTGLDSEPKIPILLLTYGGIGIAGFVAGRRWGWWATLIALPVVFATLLFARQSVEFGRLHMTQSVTWDEFAGFVYASAGRFAFSLIATVMGIWLRQRHTQELHGQAR